MERRTVRDTVAVRGAVSLIRLYQRSAPASVREACRFTPTCSEYAIHVIEHYGAVNGSARAFRRILRCRPPNGGVDMG